MFDDAESIARTARAGPYIRVDAGHPDWHRAARVLRAMGGRQFRPAAGTVYGFPTTLVRDHAIHLIRSKFGATVASPFNGTPWQPAVSPVESCDAL